MPRVPRRTQQNVGTTPEPGVRTPTNAPAGMFGAPTGIDPTGLLEATAKIAAHASDEADRTLLLDADNQLAKLETDLRTQASKRRGKDALGAREDVSGGWQKGVGEIEASLTTDRQRDAFRARAGSRWQGLYDATERHATTEWSRFQQDTTETALKNRLDDALANYNNLELVAKAGVEARAIINEQGRREGWTPVQTETRVKETLSSIHAGVISRMLTAGDDRKAAEYYRKAKGQITGDHAEKLDRALEEGSLLGESQRRADGIYKTKGITRQEAYERARAIDEPKLRKATEQQLDTEYARQDRIEREQHAELVNRAGEYADKGQRPPATLLSQLTASERRALDGYRKSVVRGDQIQTDQAAWYELQRMAGEPRTRDQFVKLNLLTYRDRLSNSDFQEMGRLQKAVAQKGDEVTRGFMTDRNIVDAVIEPLFPKAGKPGGDKDDAALAAFRREIDNSIADEKKRTGKETLPSDVVQKIADAHLLRREFARGGMGVDKAEPAHQYLTADKKGRPYVPTEHIPVAERNKIAAYLRRNGLTLTSTKVELLYGAALLRVPQQSFDEIARAP